MDTSIDYRLVFALMNGKVADAFNRKLSENFAKAQVPLTAEQWNVLLTLSMREVATQQQICDDTSFSKATMTRLVDQLETEGILERFKARVDWRSNYLRMTRKGLVIRDKGLYIASRGRRLWSVFKPIGSRAVTRRMRHFRSSCEQRVIPREGAMTGVLRALRARDVVAMVLDQHVDGRDGGGRRDHALYWTGNPKRPFSDESAFGILVLDP